MTRSSTAHETPSTRSHWLRATVVGAVMALGSGLALAQAAPADAPVPPPASRPAAKMKAKAPAGAPMFCQPQQHQMGPGPMMHNDRGMKRWLDRIDATPEQRQRIDAVHAQARKDLQGLHEQARAAHQRQAEALTRPEVDAAAAEAARQEGLALHDKASRRMLDASVEVSKILTPSQRAKLSVLRQDRAAGVRPGMPADGQPRMRHHMQHGPGMTPQSAVPASAPESR